MVSIYGEIDFCSKGQQLNLRIVLKSCYRVQAMSNIARLGINYGACFHFLYVVVL